MVEEKSKLLEMKIKKRSVMRIQFRLKKGSATAFFLLYILFLNLSSAGCRNSDVQDTGTNALQPYPQEIGLLQKLSGTIVFQSDRSGNRDIYRMNADGSNIVQLTRSEADDEYPVWSPDGRQIAFKSNRNGTFAIYIMDADGNNQRLVTSGPANDEDPAWSPDGKQIVFHSDRSGTLQLFVMNVDGSGIRRLNDTLGYNGNPAWSPDGRRIAYSGNRIMGWNVYLVDLDGRNDIRLTDGHGACRPDWSPDGNRIAFVSQKADGKGDIWLMNTDGGDHVLLTQDDRNYDYYPAWSPDGRHIAYAKTSDKKTGNWELFVMTADGKHHVQITDHPGRDEFPDWTAVRYGR